MRCTVGVLRKRVGFSFDPGGFVSGKGGCGQFDSGMLGGHVVGEEVPPCGIDTLGICQILLIDLIDEPLVRSE